MSTSNSTPSYDTPSDLALAISVTSNLRLYFSLTVVPIGMVTDLLAAAIFCTRPLNTKDTKHGYMNALFCFYQFLGLTNSTLSFQTLPYYNIYIQRFSAFWCMFFNFLIRIFQQAASFQQVLISLIFFLTIYFPSKSKFFNSGRFVSFSVFVSWVIMVLVNIEYFWFYLTYTNTNQSVSTPNGTYYVTVSNIAGCTGGSYLNQVSDIVNITFRTFVPFAVLLIFNILIIRRISKSKKNLSNNKVAAALNPNTTTIATTTNNVTTTIASSNASAAKKKTRGDTKFGRFIIAWNFFFLIMYFPWALSFIISYALTNRGIRLSNLSSGSNNTSLVYLYNISLCIAYLYNASPLFMNLIFNRLFRMEVFNLFRFNCSILRRGQSETSVVSRGAGPALPQQDSSTLKLN